LLERTEQAEAREAASKKQVDVLNEELASVRRELDEVHHANHNHWLQLEQTRQKLHDVHQANHHNWTLAEERYRQIESLVNSRSWRFITSFQRLKGISNSSEISNSLKSRLKPLIKHAALYINRRPKLRDVAIKTLNRFPAIKVRIKHIVTPADPIVVSTSQSVHVIENDGFQYLSPQTKQIYNDLKTAIERIRESG
jgi:O-antigen chain-terminating methyltransferase